MSFTARLCVALSVLWCLVMAGLYLVLYRLFAHFPALLFIGPPIALSGLVYLGRWTFTGR